MQRLSVLVVLAAAAAMLALEGAPLFSGQVHTFNDLGLFHLPVRAFYADCLARGGSFLWWPNEYTGVYLQGEGQGGLTHPFQWLLYRVLPLGTAFELELLRSPVVAFSGAFLLLRGRGLRRDAAGLGALLVGFSGFGFLHYLHPNLVGVWAHVPWLLWCIDVVLAASRPAARALATLGIVLLTASQLLLGHPQAVWLSLLVEVPWALLALRSARGGLGALLPLAAAKLLAVGVAGMQVIPTLESAALSARGRESDAFGATPALSPLDLLQLVAPYLFANRAADGIPWERGAWPGAVSVVLAVWLLLRGRALREGRSLALFGLCLALAGLWLALGDAGGLYRLQRELPLLGWLRAPARHLALVQLGLALAAAVAFQDLARPSAPLGWRQLWPLAVPAGLAVASVAVSFTFANAGIARSPLLLAAGPVLLGLAAALVAAAARGHGVALPLLVALAAIDLGAYGLSFVRQRPARSVEAFAGALALPPGDPAQRVLFGHWGLTLRDVRFAKGYLALRPQRALSFALGPGGTPAPGLRPSLRVAGVGTAYGAPVPRPLPRARFVTRTRSSADPAADISGVDVDHVALVPRSLSLDPGEPGLAEIASERPGEIVVQVATPGRQLLILSESFHPGWTARVDAVPCEVLPVYGDFMGCVVEEGTHEVVFRFDPLSFRAGLWLSALSLAFTAAWCLGIATRRRSPPSGGRV